MKNAVNANIKNTIPPMIVTEKEKKRTNKLLHLKMKHSKLWSNKKDHGILWRNFLNKPQLLLPKVKPHNV